MASSPRKPATSSSDQRLKQGREKVRFLLGEGERARDLKKARDLFDPHGTGTIDVTRITASMRAIRPLAEEQEIQRVIPFYGRTDFGDFLRMRTQKKASSSRRAAASAGPRLKEGRERIQVQLTEMQMRDMKTAFDLFDPHGTGIIDITGILVCLRVLGLPAQKDEIQKMLPVSGKIDFGVFLRVMKQNMGNTKCEEKMTMVFHLFDDDCTGKLSYENLKRVAEELEENLTDEELQEMIAFADHDSNGEITKKEFLKMMRYD